jgi:hypothetical protein
MKRAVSILAAPLLLAATPQTPPQPSPASVVEHFGDIEYDNGQGVKRDLTGDHRSGEPVLSPDGRTVVWIHIEKSPEGDAKSATSLWIGDGFTGASRKLAGEEGADDLHASIVDPQGAAFSLDGGYVYVTSALAPTGPGVHQLNILTGQQKFVINGTLRAVLRTGPYRGDLIVDRRVPKAGGEDGVDEAAFIVGTDGNKVIMVPGSDDPKSRDVVQKYLNDKGWKAW